MSILLEAQVIKMLNMKYSKRLNTGGAKATDQEVRNCLLVMTNLEHFKWLKALAEKQAFLDTLSLTDRAIDEAFYMELVTRFLVLIHKSPEQLREIDELGSYLNNESVKQASDEEFDKGSVESAFTRTFEFLANAFQENSFRRYDEAKGRYSGPMLVSLFEVVAVGLGHHLLNGGDLPDIDAYSARHKCLWNELGDKPFVGSGIRASTRIPETIRFGREWTNR